MNRALCISILVFLSLGGCSDLGLQVELETQEVLLTCVDMVTQGGSLSVVISSQEQYDRLIFERFTGPLQDYWNANYQSVLQSVTNRYPGLNDEQYADSVRRIFYSVLPFRGTENCSHPRIDFQKYSLLGQSAPGSGCGTPDYFTRVVRDDRARTVTFTVSILQHGSCEMGIDRNMWVLVPRIPVGYSVEFQKGYSRD